MINPAVKAVAVGLLAAAGLAVAAAPAMAEENAWPSHGGVAQAGAVSNTLALKFFCRYDGNIREKPSTGSRILRTCYTGEPLAVACFLKDGSNNRWYALAPSGAGWINASQVRTEGTGGARRC